MQAIGKVVCVLVGLTCGTMAIGMPIIYSYALANAPAWLVTVSPVGTEVYNSRKYHLETLIVESRQSVALEWTCGFAAVALLLVAVAAMALAAELRFRLAVPPD